MADTAYLTRLVYKESSFQGWRLTIIRGEERFERYFSDLRWGSSALAEAQAQQLRKAVLHALSLFPREPKRVFDYFRSLPHSTSESLPERKTAMLANGNEPGTKMFSFRAGKILHLELEHWAEELNIDVSSVLRLSVYMFTSWLAGQAKEKKDSGWDLFAMVQTLEEMALPHGLPPFEEFVRNVKP